MNLDRRSFIAVAAGGAPTAVLAGSPPREGIKAIALDAFAVLDPRPIAQRAEQAFPGTGTRLVQAWRTRQFEYTWLRTISGTYADFEQVTEDALRYAARSLSLDLPEATARELVESCWNLDGWPDAREALLRLKAAGIRSAFLSNFTARMLIRAAESAGLSDLLEPPLSTDRVRAFKPDARAYGMAVSAFGLRREQIVFAAFAGWDAAGAKAYGFPTFWVNRMDMPREELGVSPDATGTDLHGLADFVVRGKEGAAEPRPGGEVDSSRANGADAVLPFYTLRASRKFPPRLPPPAATTATAPISSPVAGDTFC